MAGSDIAPTCRTRYFGQRHCSEQDGSAPPASATSGKLLSGSSLPVVERYPPSSKFLNPWCSGIRQERCSVGISSVDHFSISIVIALRAFFKSVIVNLLKCHSHIADAALLSAIVHLAYASMQRPNNARTMGCQLLRARPVDRTAVEGGRQPPWFLHGVTDVQLYRGS